MIIDGHAHAIAELADTESLVEIMDSLNVDKVVLCPGGTTDTKAKFSRPKFKESFFTTRPLIILFFNRFLRRVSRV
ncbi:MAG: hypothetical protein HZR80_11295 [Candidatus Heimdallarchaeota archaeon]